MEIQGLDYNTQRPQLLMHEYGRKIQQMVDYAKTLPTKEERQMYASNIIATMKRLTPGNQKNADRMQTLWNHLAILGNGELDIDYPVAITLANKVNTKPDRVKYPEGGIPVRHYGKALFKLFDILKTMEPGIERDELTKMTANQMKRCLMQYGHGNTDAAKIADDLALFTDGAVKLDIKTFRFESINIKDMQQPSAKKKRRKKK